MGRRELLDAERQVLDLEDELLAAKGSGAECADVKLRLREARRVYRTLREGGDPGEGVARPATVATGTEV
jgi:hypothetical protein